MEYKLAAFTVYDLIVTFDSKYEIALSFVYQGEYLNI